MTFDRRFKFQVSSVQILRGRWMFCVLWILSSVTPSWASTATFAEANQLYEQGKFEDAAATYDRLIQSGARSTGLYFNLGNAWFKAGQRGRAIAAYRRAEQLAPRDPDVRFNLQFTRNEVTGNETPLDPAWQRMLASLTLNEWTTLASVAWWLWFALLAARELRPGWRKGLRGYTATAGVAFLILGVGVALAARQRRAVTSAVIVVPQAVVRNGPLEVSPVAYQLRDGSEVTVLDQIEQPDAARTESKQSWLKVQDAARRIGWVKRDQADVLTPFM